MEQEQSHDLDYQIAHIEKLYKEDHDIMALIEYTKDIGTLIIIDKINHIFIFNNIKHYQILL